MTHHDHEIERVPEGEQRTLFEHHRVIQELFEYFRCQLCGEHLYMLKEDLDKRAHDVNMYGSVYAIADLSNVQERGSMFIRDKDTGEWVLLYTIIS